ncbi:MAG: hypothetical protein K2X39_07240 [Silvanigrellaceae bacterium]|nr:hypothetical protein [Silvanigrellaceae bacterium]
MTKKELRGFFIGETSLCLQCAQEFIAQGNTIVGFLSRDPFVLSWAQKHSIPAVSLTSELENLNLYGNIDYIFSIVNYSVLSDKILNFAKYSSINFHDGPLPKYAGTHATSWALLNEESYHGVTWHEMSSGIDAGRILKQEIFLLQGTETAFQLNLKCYEIAIKTFKELINELQTETIKPIQQDLSQRTFFSRNQKPHNFGFAIWNDSAEDIFRLYRSLNFGEYDNTFCSFKVFFNDSIFYPGNCFLTLNQSQYPAGRIQKITEEGIYISTLTNDIVFEKFKDRQGKECSIDYVVNSSGIKEGDILKEINIECLKEILNLTVRISSDEFFWVKKNLQKGQLAQLPLLEGDSSYIYTDDSFPGEKSQSYTFANLVVSSFLIYLNRSGNALEFTLGFMNSFIDERLKEFNILLPKVHPFTNQFFARMQIFEIFTEVKESLEKHKTFLMDIFIRYPLLKEKYCDFYPLYIKIGSSDFSINSLSDEALSRPFMILEIIEEQRIFKIHLKNIDNSCIYLSKVIALNLNKIANMLLYNPHLYLRDIILDNCENVKFNYDEKNLGVYSENEISLLLG